MWKLEAVEACGRNRGAVLRTEVRDAPPLRGRTDLADADRAAWDDVKVFWSRNDLERARLTADMMLSPLRKRSLGLAIDQLVGRQAGKIVQKSGGGAIGVGERKQVDPCHRPVLSVPRSTNTPARCHCAPPPCNAASPAGHEPLGRHIITYRGMQVAPTADLAPRAQSALSQPLPKSCRPCQCFCRQ